MDMSSSIRYGQGSNNLMGSLHRRAKQRFSAFEHHHAIHIWTHIAFLLFLKNGGPEAGTRELISRYVLMLRYAHLGSSHQVFGC